MTQLAARGSNGGGFPCSFLEIEKQYPVGSSSHMLYMKCSSKCPYTRKPSMSRKISGCTPAKLSLLTIYKLFVRPNLDFGDITYDQALTIHFIVSLKEFNIMQHWP